MKKVSDVFKSIRFAKLDPNHDKGPKISTDDEEHYSVGEKEYDQQLKHAKKRSMQEAMSPSMRMQRALQKAKEQREREQRAGEKLLAPKQPVQKEDIEQIDEISLDLAKRARDKAEHLVDMDHDDMRDRPYGYSEKQRVKFQKYVDKKEPKKDVKEDVEQILEYGDTAKGQKMLTKVHKRAVNRLIKADDKNMQEPDYTKRDLKTVRKHQATADRAWDRMSEEVEQIDEISSGLATSYLNKREPQHKPNMNTPETSNRDAKVAKGIRGAVSRVHGYGPDKGAENKVTGRFQYRKNVGATHTFNKEEVEQIDEVSLGNYKEKATQQVKELKPYTKGEYGDIAKRAIERREKGLKMASKRVSEEVDTKFKPGDFVKDTVYGHVHRVHKVEGNNLVVNRHHGKDSYGTFTNIHKTKAHKVQTPTNEEVVAEGKMKQLHPDSDLPDLEPTGGNKPPFSGPYKKNKGTVTDKSGAKHTPMSRVRDLARQAIKKNMKESTITESRKAEIVKEIVKKKKSEGDDKFVADPTLTSQVQKTDQL